MIQISAPGRICLFGEHQDYLQLPVITAAINRRVTITATSRADTRLVIDLPDTNSREVLDISSGAELPYQKPRDYFRSMYNVLLRRGMRLSHGYNCIVRGDIPINSGTSSSSALINVWCRFLLEVAQGLEASLRKPAMVGHLAWLAEVVEFNEPGGKMDQIATAMGGCLHIDFAAGDLITSLPAQFGAFVLGDSLQPKDTMKILAQTKAPALAAADKLAEVIPDFRFDIITPAQLDAYGCLLSENEFTVMQAMLHNRDICRLALKQLRQPQIDHAAVGQMLTMHHRWLSDNLQISTPRIEAMLAAAMDAGALGGKINGSGGGGCMFAYAPHHAAAVATAIKAAGGNAYVVRVDDGLRVERK